jgi:hypothetical protein
MSVRELGTKRNQQATWDNRLAQALHRLSFIGLALRNLLTFISRHSGEIGCLRVLFADLKLAPLDLLASKSGPHTAKTMDSNV